MNPISKLLKNRRALSTVVTTLIILVVSVLLASVVTYFAINMVSTRTQEENLFLTKQHIWFNPDTDSGDPARCQASLMIANTGGRDVVIDKITVRGQECAWNNDDDGKFVIYCITNEPPSEDMTFQPTIAAPGGDDSQDLTFTDGGTEYTFLFADTDIILPSSYSLLVYIVNPDSISINDVGLTVSLSLFTAQSTYYKEANVQAYVP
jgi:hypothetical protein